LSIRIFKSDLLLLLTAAIWGSAFVAQKAGLDHIGPYVFNTLRFSLGCLVLIPVIILTRNKSDDVIPGNSIFHRSVIPGGLIAGVFVFFGATFQQTGLMDEATTAGKAGFITGLYIIIVPIIGLLWRHRIGAGTWFGAIIATIGLYLLSGPKGFALSRGDTLVLMSAFVWAGHVHLIGWLSPRVNTIKLAFTQFAVCSFISFIIALNVEGFHYEPILNAAIPVLYAGVISVGIAYTLQVVAQRHSPPVHASIIMSLESVFALIAGILIRKERLTSRGIVGCALMLAGMISSAATRRSWGKGDTATSQECR
jgi:drug/metabolite transporter (DMT)-like permease